MFALGKIVFDKTGQARELQRLGERDLRRRLPKPARSVTENAKYHLWDGLDELGALQNQKLPGFAYASYVLLHELLKSYSRFLGAEMCPVGKTWRILNSSEYRRKQAIASFPDRHFVEMFLSALDDPAFTRMQTLACYVQRKMGGFYVDAWKLRTPME